MVVWPLHSGGFAQLPSWVSFLVLLGALARVSIAQPTDTKTPSENHREGSPAPSRSHSIEDMIIPSHQAASNTDAQKRGREDGPETVQHSPLARLYGPSQNSPISASLPPPLKKIKKPSGAGGDDKKKESPLSRLSRIHARPLSPSLMDESLSAHLGAKSAWIERHRESKRGSISGGGAISSPSLRYLLGETGRPMSQHARELQEFTRRIHGRPGDPFGAYKFSRDNRERIARLPLAKQLKVLDKAWQRRQKKNLKKDEAAKRWQRRRRRFLRQKPILSSISPKRKLVRQQEQENWHAQRRFLREGQREERRYGFRWQQWKDMMHWHKQQAFLAKESAHNVLENVSQRLHASSLMTEEPPSQQFLREHRSMLDSLMAAEEKHKQAMWATSEPARLDLGREGAEESSSQAERMRHRLHLLELYRQAPFGPSSKSAFGRQVVVSKIANDAWETHGDRLIGGDRHYYRLQLEDEYRRLRGSEFRADQHHLYGPTHSALQEVVPHANVVHLAQLHAQTMLRQQLLHGQSPQAQQVLRRIFNEQDANRREGMEAQSRGLVDLQQRGGAAERTLHDLITAERQGWVEERMPPLDSVGYNALHDQLTKHASAMGTNPVATTLQLKQETDQERTRGQYSIQKNFYQFPIPYVLNQDRTKSRLQPEPYDLNHLVRHAKLDYNALLYPKTMQQARLAPDPPLPGERPPRVQLPKAILRDNGMRKEEIRKAFHQHLQVPSDRPRAAGSLSSESSTVIPYNVLHDIRPPSPPADDGQDEVTSAPKISNRQQSPSSSDAGPPTEEHPGPDTSQQGTSHQGQ